MIVHDADIPKDLHINQVISVRIFKRAKIISICWRQGNLLFGSKKSYNDLIPAISRLKQQILRRPQVNDRIELWECQNEHGVYDWDIEQKLKKVRRIND